MKDELDVSERRACRVVGQHRSTQRRLPTPRSDQANLTQAVINLAEKFGRYGYRRITALLNREGWRVSVGRVYRIWRREGLKVPQKQPKRGRLWLNDGSCVRLRPTHKGHVWSYDFVQDRTHEGKVFRMLCIIDEFTRECLAIRVERRLNSRDVLDELGEALCPSRATRAYSLGQRPRVHRNSPKGVAWTARHQDFVHRARQPLGEWVL